LQIPSSLNTINDFAFINNLQLNSFTVDTSNQNFSSTDGVLFNKSGTTLVAYPAAKGSTYVIPNSVTSIGAAAFFNTQIASVTIPSSVINIGNFALSSNRLTSIEFPNSVTTIDGDAFSSNLLTSVTIPRSVSSIGSFAFDSNRITRVNLLGNAPAINPLDAFSSNPDLSFLDVDAETTGWGETFSGVQIRRNYLAAFDSNSGSLVSSQRFSTGLPVAAPTAPTRAGHTFAGWSATNGGPAISFPYNPGVAENVTLFAKWNEIPVVITPPAALPSVALPSVDLAAQAAVADLATRTLRAKTRFAIKPLAARVGVRMVSPRAKVTFKVAKASRKVCTKSGSRLRTLRPGNCVVTFTVQEPKPKKGKAPRATRTVKTLVVR
jgi:uncharacterized repeat protein (TIGR02543 family)